MTEPGTGKVTKGRNRNFLARWGGLAKASLAQPHQELARPPIARQGCLKLASEPTPHWVGTFRRNVRAWAETGASAKRHYLTCAPRIELDAALRLSN